MKVRSIRDRPRRLLAGVLSVVLLVSLVPAGLAAAPASPGQEEAQGVAEFSQAKLIGKYDFEDLTGPLSQETTVKNTVDTGVDGRLPNATLSNSATGLSIESDESNRSFGNVLRFGSAVGKETHMEIDGGIDLSKDWSASIWFKSDEDNHKTTLLQQPDSGKTVLDIEGKKLATSVFGNAQQSGSAYEELTQWHQAVITFDSKAGSVGFFLDGVFSDTVTGSLVEGARTEKRLFVGNHKGSTPDVQMIGVLDDLQIYDGLLTADDVQILFNQHSENQQPEPEPEPEPSPSATLIGKYDFDEMSESGDLANQTVQNKVSTKTGTVLAAATFTSNTTGLSIETDTSNRNFGKVLKFDSTVGAQTHMEIANGIDLSKDWSASIWFQSNATDNQKKLTLLQQPKNGKTVLDVEEKKLATSLFGGSKKSEDAYSDITQWHHAAITFDSDVTSLGFYLDGEFSGTATGVLADEAGTETTLYVGNHKGSETTAQMIGFLDDLQIYEGVLTAEDVANLYKQHPENSEPAPEPKPESPVSTPLIGKYDFEDLTESGQISPDTNVKNKAADETEGKLDDATFSSNVTGLSVESDTSGRNFGKVLKFDTTVGTNTRMEITDGIDLSKDWSASIWFQSSAEDSHKLTLLQQPNSGRTVLDVEEKHLATVIQGPELKITSETGYDNLKKWHQAGIIYDAQEETICFIQDGELSNTISATPEDAVVQEKKLLVGNHKSEPNVQMFGFLDDLQIYGGVLTAEEVKEIYKQHAEGTEPPPEEPIISATLIGKYDFEDLGDAVGGLSSAHVQNKAPEGTETLLPYATFSNNATGLSVENDTTNRNFGTVLKFTTQVGAATHMEIANGVDLSDDWSASVWFQSNENNHKTTLLQQPDSGRTVLLVDQNHLATMISGSQVTSTDAYEDLTKWHQAVFTFDHAENTVGFYLDGKLSGTHNVTPESGVISTKTLYVGNHKGQENNIELIGFLDDLQIFKGVLSADDVTKLYNQHAPGEEPGPVEPPVSDDPLVGHYTFDNESDTDQTVKNNATGSNKLGDATLTHSNGDSIKEEDSGITEFGKVLHFKEGSSLKMSISNAIDASKAYTLSMWLKEEDEQRTDKVSLFQQDGQGRSILNLDTSGKLESFVNGKSTYSDGTVKTGRWQHVAVSYLPGEGKVSFYIDGELDSTKVLSEFNGNSPHVGTTALIIGHHKDSNSNTLHGYVDDVRVYTKTLNNEDIWDIYAEQGRTVEQQKLKDLIQQSEELLKTAEKYAAPQDAIEALETSLESANKLTDESADEPAFADVRAAEEDLQEKYDKLFDAVPLYLTIDKDTAERENFEGSIFGANHRFAIEGYSTFDPKTGEVRDEFNEQFARAGFGMTRFPGGSCANLYRWKLGLGPLDSRPKQIPPYYDQGTEPYSGDFGIMEALTWAEEQGVETSYTYGIAYSSVQDAEDLIEFLNAPNDGSNVNEGVDWAAVRAELGHPEPFNIRYFEVGNETQQTSNDNGTSCQGYWIGHSVTNSEHSDVSGNNLKKFLYGGEVQMNSKRAVKLDDWREEGTKTTGAENEKFYLPYANENPRNEEDWTKIDETFGEAVDNVTSVKVGEETYTVIESKDEWQKKGSNDKVVFLNKSDGSLTFGDGTHGKIPEVGNNVTVSYTMHHDGFIDIAKAMKETMKQIDPDAECKVYAGWEGANLPEELRNSNNDDCYDGIVVHAYSGTPANSSEEDFYDDAMRRADVQQKSVEKYVGYVEGKEEGHEDKEVVISEFGIYNTTNPLIRAQTGAVYLAKAFLGFMSTNVTYAERHCLVDFYSNKDS